MFKFVLPEKIDESTKYGDEHINLTTSSEKNYMNDSAAESKIW